MTDSDHQRSVVERYLAAHSRSDVDGIVALFAADATVRDPADAEPFVGVDAIRRFFSSTHETMDSLTLTLDGPVRCCGEFAAFPMTARAVMGELVTEIDIIDVFTFDDAGLVTEMRAYWSGSDLRVVS
ncbi:MAG TPA: nuclear transport factor 2 family protein [Microthrixaceae bacterium]|nr:nuclear transport factor 2 family protein [Microthrixaceae bacterium]HMT23501.1 nuclear transport factor 2 family protein [Microthrixaceae bacterium]HMT61252.1 nuclear transport factor 2 family protein [Microthrixaceae bacterium]